MGPGRAGVYSNLVPIYSAILGVLILNEAFGLYHMLSIGIVITGLTIISRSKQKRRSSAELSGNGFHRGQKLGHFMFTVVMAH